MGGCPRHAAPRGPSRTHASWRWCRTTRPGRRAGARPLPSGVRRGHAGARGFAACRGRWRRGTFLCEYPSRCSARCMEARLVTTPVRAVSASINSTAVASGVLTTRRVSSSATLPRMGEKLPPPRGRGATPPVSRCSRSTRLTVASPMPSRRAICSYVRPSSWKARTMACRSFSGVGSPTLIPYEDQTPTIASTEPRVSGERRRERSTVEGLRLGRADVN